MSDTPKNRSIVCCFCGAFWPYVEGVSDRDALIKIATEHEATCASNPYTTKINQLERELAEAREQRDMLAKALRKIDRRDMLGWCGQVAHNALAAVKGGDK
jgi:predicted RNase H-like nuclease (RuvC/YqgF family)